MMEGKSSLHEGFNAGYRLGVEQGYNEAIGKKQAQDGSQTIEQELVKLIGRVFLKEDKGYQESFNAGYKQGEEQGYQEGFAVGRRQKAEGRPRKVKRN